MKCAVGLMLSWFLIYQKRRNKRLVIIVGRTIRECGNKELYLYPY